MDRAIARLSMVTREEAQLSVDDILRHRVFSSPLACLLQETLRAILSVVLFRPDMPRSDAHFELLLSAHVRGVM